MSYTRLDPRARRQKILTVAIGLAVEIGYKHLTLRGVAQEAGISHPLVHNYFPTMQLLKAAVMQRAIRDRILPIIAQGIVARDPAAMAVPFDVKFAAATWLFGEDGV